ncbi:MAG: hypothetical protein K4305_09060 [Chlorobium sp.]|uniref:hypothetical protein n=1 Tax=Chlorobium sp. TaxID=1095 RepID=UPI002F401FCD
MNEALMFLQQNGLAIAIAVVPVVIGVAIGARKVAVANVLRESGEVLTALGSVVETTSPETVRRVFTEAKDFRDALAKLTTVAK